LSQLVDRSISNAFIGFGIHHDSTMLNTLSDGENSAYYFIDQLENAGYVYGEILHGIMYKLLKNVTLHIDNGLIYDFKNNIWTNSLVIGEIVSEANKIFHICSNQCDECIVTVTAQLANANSVSIEFIVRGENSDVKDIVDNNTFDKYIYRQRTLQHLFVVKDFLKRKNEINNIKDSIFMNVNKDDITELKKEEINISENLRNFIMEMKEFMLKNNLNEDNFIKNLCDDIYICYRTFATTYGDMYVSARQQSQGLQRSYTTSHTPEDIDNGLDYDNNKCHQGLLKPILTRGYAVSRVGVPLTPQMFSEPYPLTHNTMKIVDAPYLTPTSRKIIREISGKNDTDNDNEGHEVEI
jgi:hypothetical protein